MPSTAPVFIACAHGTRDPAGRRAVGRLVAGIAAARPGLEVRAAYVDLHPPFVGEVVREVTDAGRAAVVVPLLLSIGYHVGVDVQDAVRGRAAAAAPALGPDDRITAVLLDRLHALRMADDDAVVVAAAGSSDTRAALAVEQVAQQVREQQRGPVSVGYGASASPSVLQAVARLRAQRPGSRVVIAAYLLAPGHFHDRLRRAGSDAVAAPLLLPDDAADARLVAVALDRYDAVTARARRAPAR